MLAVLFAQKKEERRRKDAPQGPAKGIQERALAAAPRSGSVVKALFLEFQERLTLRLAILEEQWLDAHASVRLLRGRFATAGEHSSSPRSRERSRHHAGPALTVYLVEKRYASRWERFSTTRRFG
jgi:hypothetical protein